MRLYLSTLALVTALGGAAAQETDARKELIARAKSFELNTPYEPPPGDALEHHAAGFAKVMCWPFSSQVWIPILPPRTLVTSSRRTPSARR